MGATVVISVRLAWLILLGATVVMVLVVIPYRGRP